MDETLPQALARIQHEWGLTDAEMARLTLTDAATYRGWLTRPEPSEASIPPGMDHAVPLVRIQRVLQRWFPQPDEQLKWLTTPHRDFGGHRPSDIAASSPERLQWVAYYLETYRDR